MKRLFLFIASIASILTHAQNKIITFDWFAGDQSTAISISASTITFLGNSETLGSHGYPHTVTPRMVWHNGKTYFAYVHKAETDVADATDTGGRLTLITYDENYGLSRPVGILNRQSDYDTHHAPTWYIDNATGQLRIVMESHHNIDPLMIVKNRTIGDDLIWQVTANTIGTNSGGSGYPTYPNIYNENGVFTLISQVDNTDAGFNKNITGDFEGAWSNDAKITTRDADEPYHYVTGVFNGHKSVGNRVVFTVSARSNDVTPNWFRKYLIKAEVLAGGITYYDFDESFSKTSRLTVSEQNTNFKYYNTAGSTSQGYTPQPSLDDDGNFYDFSGNGLGGYVFAYWLNGASSPVTKTITLPGSPTLLDGNDGGATGNGQNSPCVLILPYSTADVRIFVRHVSGLYRKCIEYKTTDLGTTWTLVGDPFSDINDDIHSIVVPYNVFDIPTNRNFVIVGRADNNPTWSNLYFKKAARGTIQSETGGNPYTAVTAYTASEYDALQVRSYYIETGKITSTGTTCNSLIDQSPSALNVNSSGSPVLNSSVTPAYVTLDGTNDYFSLPITGLTALTEGTIIAVVRFPSGAAGNGSFLNASKNTVTNHFRQWIWNADDVVRFNQSYGGNTVDVKGKTTLSRSDFYIIAFVHQNGGCGVMKWVNGELQLDNYVSKHKFEGKFFADFSGTMTNLEVGRLVRTTTGFHNFELSHIAISSTPFNWTQLSKSFKYLSNKYGIALNTFYTQ